LDFSPQNMVNLGHFFMKNPMHRLKASLYFLYLKNIIKPNLISQPPKQHIEHSVGIHYHIVEFLNNCFLFGKFLQCTGERKRCLGANEITWTTLACLKDCFWENISWNIFTKVLKKKNLTLNFFLILLCQGLCKMFQEIFHIQKVLKPIYNSIFCLIASITMCSQCFWKTIIYWRFFKFIHVFQWYIRNLTI
jgi:hypothetical protein